MLPRASFDALYAAGPDVIMAGSANPTGTATPVEGGYLVTGQWAFVSGCQHAPAARARSTPATPLQRRLRDAHALIQHLTMGADTFTKVGAVLAGQDVDLTLV